MKNIIITLLLLLPLKILAQNTITIKHKNYITTFDKQKNYPIITQWWLTKKMISCKSPLKRKNIFYPDPQYDTNLNHDYTNSGYDRGHMMPAADNLCQPENILTECFYFTNIAPQLHSLNAGDWKELENFTRTLSQKYDSIYVWAGNVGNLKKINNLTIPKYCWKVIYIKKLNKYIYYMFQNIDQPSKPLDNYIITKSEFQKITNIKIKTDVQ